MHRIWKGDASLLGDASGVIDTSERAVHRIWKGDASGVILGTNYCTPRIDTSDIIMDFQWHLPMDGCSVIFSSIILFASGIFKRVVTFPVDFHWNCPMDFQWHFPMELHFSEFWCVRFWPGIWQARHIKPSPTNRNIIHNTDTTRETKHTSHAAESECCKDLDFSLFHFDKESATGYSLTSFSLK